jgi:integration host factor subunit alpha
MGHKYIKMVIRKNVTKQTIANDLAKQTGLSKAQTTEVINDIITSIIEIIQQDKKLLIPQFGTFLLRDKKARIGRNPKTKKEHKIAARSLISFKPSEIFKKYINE